MRILLIAFVVSITAPAAAAIFEMDLLVSDDALVTRDTEQDLDWLDVTLTVGLGGVPGVLGGAGGWIDAGWRLATTAEVCSFFGRASGYPLNCPGVTWESGSYGQPVLDLLGITDVREQPYGNGTLYLDQLWASFDDGDLSDQPGGVELSVDTHSSGWVKTYLSIRENDDYSNVLLVRPIPEPSTGALVLLGLAALAHHRRSQARTASLRDLVRHTV